MKPLPDFPDLCDIRAVELMPDTPGLSEFYGCERAEETQYMLLQVWSDVETENHQKYTIILKAIDEAWESIIAYPRSFQDFTRAMREKYNLLGNEENTPREI